MSRFWEQHPALFFSQSLLLGTASAFYLPYLCFFLWLIIHLSNLKVRKRCILISFLLFFTALLVTPFRCPQTTLTTEKIQGIGQFHIQNAQVQSSPFHRSLVYKGVLTHFQGDQGQMYHHLPCSIYLPLNSAHPPVDYNYEIRGTLSQKTSYSFNLKPMKNAQWIPIKKSSSLKKWRHKAKKKLSSYLKNHLFHPETKVLLSALATGEVDERLVTMEFGKVGLQHLLVISGFHFALVAFFMRTLFISILPNQVTSVLLLIFLTGYFLFLGGAPSIQRAYLAIALVLIGNCFDWKISGLNALGAALFIEIAIHPLSVTQLGFQLSFLCTIAILLFYPLTLSLFKLLFPKHTPSELKQMSLFERHGYFLFLFFRQSLALNLSIHFLSLPLLLYYFHRFPFLSLAYNLFFPLCLALSLFLLCIAMLLNPISAVCSQWIHFLNDEWTAFLLKIVSNPPFPFDFVLRCRSLSISNVIFSIVLFIFIGMILQRITKKKEIDSSTFV